MYIGLASFASKESRLAWPSIQKLAEELGMDRRNVQRCIRKLEEAGYIAATGKKRRWMSEYLVFAEAPPEIQKLCVCGDAEIEQGCVSPDAEISEPKNFRCVPRDAHTASPETHKEYGEEYIPPPYPPHGGTEAAAPVVGATLFDDPDTRSDAAGDCVNGASAFRSPGGSGRMVPGEISTRERRETLALMVSAGTKKQVATLVLDKAIEDLGGREAVRFIEGLIREGVRPRDLRKAVTNEIDRRRAPPPPKPRLSPYSKIIASEDIKRAQRVHARFRAGVTPHTWETFNACQLQRLNGSAVYLAPTQKDAEFLTSIGPPLADLWRTERKDLQDVEFHAANQGENHA